MKPRTVRRLCLVDGMNLDHIEGWLESMAARGLHYDHSDAFLFHFRHKRFFHPHGRIHRGRIFLPHR